MLLLGLHGPAQSGKDTTCSLIQEWARDRGLVAKRGAFADKLKLSAYRVFKPDCTLEEALEWCNEMKFRGKLIAGPVSPRYVKGDDGEWLPENIERHNISGREFLQHYGTEAHRDVFGPDFWVDALLPLGSSTEQMMGPSSPEIHRSWEDNFTTDGFPGNFYADIAVITDVRFESEADRIHKLGGVVARIERKSIETGDAHVSEKPLPTDAIDFTINNNGSLEDLKAEVASIMGDMTGDTT